MKKKKKKRLLTHNPWRNTDDLRSICAGQGRPGLASSSADLPGALGSEDGTWDLQAVCCAEARCCPCS